MIPPSVYREMTQARLRGSVLVGAVVIISLAVLAGGVVYSASPYLSTRSTLARLSDRSLPAAISDEELATIAGNLRTALDHRVPGGQDSEPTSLLGQVGKIVVDEVRNQFLDEVSSRLASREGIAMALYGWEAFGGRKVAIERAYVDFPGTFAVSMIDETTGTSLVELVYIRSGFATWRLAIVRPFWVRTQPEAALRELVRAGIQRFVPPNPAPARP